MHPFYLEGELVFVLRFPILYGFAGTKPDIVGSVVVAFPGIGV
jgi:hypothetical protein